jgi:hypothetical protein
MIRKGHTSIDYLLGASGDLPTASYKHGSRVAAHFGWFGFVRFLILVLA